MPGRGPIILSDFRQVIYQSGMKGGGGWRGFEYSFIPSVMPGGGGMGAQNQFCILSFRIGEMGWVDWQTKLV